MNTDELRSKRIKHALTQKEIAEKLGMSTKSYNRKELGVIDFSREEIKNISSVLDLTKMEIIEIFFEDIITKR